MTSIESADYEATRKRLMEDPIVIAMAQEIRVDLLANPDTFLHDEGKPRFEFMQVCNGEYQRRGGKDGGHIGAIAEAIITLAEQDG